MDNNSVKEEEISYIREETRKVYMRERRGFKRRYWTIRVYIGR